jgi:hypothetical protein
MPAHSNQAPAVVGAVTGLQPLRTLAAPTSVAVTAVHLVPWLGDSANAQTVLLQDTDCSDWHEVADM